MTWKTYHRRGEVLRTVITVAAERRDGLLPMDVDGVAQTFGDELTLLAALQLKWHTRLAGHLERALAEQPLDLDAAVVEAWGAAADELPGVRLVLDHYRAHPSGVAMRGILEIAVRKEHAMLAVMAGRSGVDAVDEVAAARIGARLEYRARAARQPAATLILRPTTFLERLRAVLAA